MAHAHLLAGNPLSFSELALLKVLFQASAPLQESDNVTSMNCLALKPHPFPDQVSGIFIIVPRTSWMCNRAQITPQHFGLHFLGLLKYWHLLFKSKNSEIVLASHVYYSFICMFKNVSVFACVCMCVHLPAEAHYQCSSCRWGLHEDVPIILCGR